jgi:hypothetical protein
VVPVIKTAPGLLLELDALLLTTMKPGIRRASNYRVGCGFSALGCGCSTVGNGVAVLEGLP